jgi:DNA-binding NarL/FixJ family response regulator
MTSPDAINKLHNEVALSAAGIKIFIADRRALLRQSLAKALAAAWSDVSCRMVDTQSIEALTEEDAVDAAILFSGRGLAENGELRDDLRRIRSASPITPVLVVTDSVEAADVAIAIRSGAKGYLASSVALEVLIQSLRLMMIGGTAFPAIELADRPFNGINSSAPLPSMASDRKAPISPIELFTPKEREVLSKLAEGKPNKIIAYELNICETTVKVHMRHIMSKLGVTNRTHAALLASEMLINFKPPN